MNKSPQYNQQSEVEEICIYQNTESGRHSIYIYCGYLSGFHARKNPNQPSFSKKRIYV